MLELIIILFIAFIAILLGIDITANYLWSSDIIDFDVYKYICFNPLNILIVWIKKL